jgi:hypothetical protein
LRKKAAMVVIAHKEVKMYMGVGYSISLTR